MSFLRHISRSIAALAAAACGAAPGSPPHRTGVAAELATDIGILASDRYEGRRPGTRGEDSTITFLESRLREIGLEPGNPDGTYRQAVPLVAVRTEAKVSLEIGGKAISLPVPQEIVARSVSNTGKLQVDRSELVFAGYGIDAPEYDWDDYAGIDVRGKTIAVLLGVPSFGAFGLPESRDPSAFKGDLQPLHGTLRAKRDAALRRGAAALIGVYGLGPPADYSATTPGFLTEAYDLDTPDHPPLPVTGAISAARLRGLLRPAGQDLDSLYRRAQTHAFRAVPTGILVSFDLTLHPRAIPSHNIVARLTGSDPRLRNEYVVFSAHWDGFGRDSTKRGDQIRNGAMDNAGGVAQLLAIAKGLKSLPTPPRRTTLFVFTTGEEMGLLGARYYVQHPLYPLARTVANINFDNFFPYAKTADVINYGDGRSDLDDRLRVASKDQGRDVSPDPFPEEGFYYRMDHFEFANAGVPAISPSMGVDVIGKGPNFGHDLVERYLNHDYHQVSDEIHDDWDYGAATQDVAMGISLGKQVGDDDQRPGWKPRSEFKARREADLKKAGVR